MPQAVSVTPLPSAGMEAASSAAPSGAPADGTGAAPFAQVLAKASATGPQAGADKALENAPGKAGELDAKANTNAKEAATPVDAVIAAMRPAPPPELPPGAARGTGEHAHAGGHRSEKGGGASAKQSGNDLPPLAVPLAVPLPTMALSAPAAQRGASAQVAEGGPPAVRACAVPSGDAAAWAAQMGSGTARKQSFDALGAALQMPPTGGRAAASSPAPASALAFAEVRQVLSPTGLSSLTASKEAQSPVPTSKAGAQPGEIPAQAGTLFAPWAPPAAGSPSPTYQGAVATPLASPHWGQELGQQLLIGIQGNSQTVTLHVNPPQLGPLQVHLQVTDGQASALFVSPHLAVRQALEGALPQLRDIFAGAGMSLLQTHVSADGGGSRRDQPHYTSRAAAGVRATDEESMPAAAYWRLGFVNTYV